MGKSVGKMSAYGFFVPDLILFSNGLTEKRAVPIMKTDCL